jgi:hypothetical protein
MLMSDCSWIMVVQQLAWDRKAAHPERRQGVIERLTIVCDLRYVRVGIDKSLNKAATYASKLLDVF